LNYESRIKNQESEILIYLLIDEFHNVKRIIKIPNTALFHAGKFSEEKPKTQGESKSHIPSTIKTILVHFIF